MDLWPKGSDPIRFPLGLGVKIAFSSLVEQKCPSVDLTWLAKV
jgi:hypothetical protein